MTTADKVFKTLVASITNETGVEPKGIKQIYDEVTTLRFTVEQPLGLLTRLIQCPIDGSFEPEAGDQFLKDGVSLGLASEVAQNQSLRSAYDKLLSTIQSGKLPAKTDAAYQRFSARFWRLDTCGTCAGMGVSTCGSCFGEKTFSCPTCHGSAQVSCGCQGGRFLCTLCHGTGMRVEKRWEYRDVKISQSNAPTRFESHQFEIIKQVSCGCEMGWTRCNTCSGSGTLDCPAIGCSGGRTNCATCLGSGETPPCKPCQGSGETGILHEGSVHLNWGQSQVILPPKTRDVENLVLRALGSDSRLVRESTSTFKAVMSCETAQSPYAMVVTQDAQLKIIRVDVDLSGKTYQVIGYGTEPILVSDGGLQSLLAAPIRQERAANQDKARLAHAINRQALIGAINSLAQTEGKPSASANELRVALKTSMQSVYFKEEVNRLLSDPSKSEHYHSGLRLDRSDDHHHRFRTSFLDSCERIFKSLKRQYVTTALLCIALVVALGTWFGNPLIAGAIGLLMTPIGLHNCIFNKLLFNQFQGIFDSPETRFASFKRLMCSESVFLSFAKVNQ